MDFLKFFSTRWKYIGSDQGYRLACSHPVCSLSCANLKKGKISITSVHGTERHSYELTKADMYFAFIKLIEGLNDKEQENFVNIVNKCLDRKVISIENLIEKI